MKKHVTKSLAAVMAAALVLSGCGGSGGGTGGSSGTGTAGGNSGTESTTQGAQTPDDSKAIKDLVTYELVHKEVESFNVLNSQKGEDSNVLCNLIDGLLSIDSKGQLIPGIAKSWGTDDGGKTWTFNLREGVKWVDLNGAEMADCTAQDFITGLEFVLNYHKNEASNTSMPIEMIKGAGEYYEYTKELSKEEALSMDNSKFLEMVGIEAPDDYTLIYTCLAEKPYFDTVANYNCLYPASAALIEKLGVDNFRACTYDTMWYNGAYILTSFIHGNEKILTKNEAYWDTEISRFETVTIKILDSQDLAFQAYQAGDIDHVDLSESTLKTIYDNTGNEFNNQIVEKRPRKFSYQMQFNYAKQFEDGTLDENWNTAIANTAFRKSWYYGLDLVSFWQRYNAINPLNCENNAYTMKGLIYTADGSDYTSLVAEKLGLPESDGSGGRRVDAAKAAEFKAQAIEELTAAGVTFPVQIDYFVAASNQTQVDTATVLAQTFSDCLGDDYVKLNIKTFITSQMQEVIDPRLHSIAINGWGADYADPQNYLGQSTYGEDNAYYSVKYNNTNKVTEGELVDTYKEFTDMVHKADAITTDMEARYEAYAEAEAFMLDNVLVLPLYLDIQWQLTRINDYSKPYAMYGIQNYKYVGWETSVDAYTTEQYDSLRTANEAN